MIETERKAKEIRKVAFQLMHDVGAGHYGGNLSEIEILTVLYDKVLNVTPKNITSPDRDRFIMSKGHGGFGLYAVLSYFGFVDYSVIANVDEFGVLVPKHASSHVPGVEVSTGSLGQGLSIATGIALGLRADGNKARVYTMLGDGECNEGQIWEAAMTAGKYKLDNLIAIVDNNLLQFDGPTSEVMPIEPQEDKWEAFGWMAIRVNGNDVNALIKAFDAASCSHNKPIVIIADTVKGKGISYMENVVFWHAGSVSQEQFERGMRELEVQNGNN